MQLLQKKDNKAHLLIDFFTKSFYSVFPGYKFYKSWYIELLVDRLQGVAAGKIKRLMINMPPRSLKSLLVSVSWPAWLLGCNPKIRIIVASYSSMLSVKHSLDTRCIINTEWYKNMFPDLILSKEQNTKYKFQTTHQGFRVATSLGGSLTGEGADILIADDPMTPLQALSQKLRLRAIDWFEQTFMTRLNDRQRGSVIIVMHRLHSEDLCGYLISKPNNMWEKLSLPLLAEETEQFKKFMSTNIYTRKANSILDNKRYLLEDVNLLKLELGTQGFAAQYQQNPIAFCNSLIKKEWINRYKILPSNYTIIHSWDTANSANSNSDYSAGLIFANSGAKWYLLEVIRGKWEYSALKNTITQTAQIWKPSAILIEEKGSGQQLCQELKEHTKLPIIGRKPYLDKTTRLIKVLPLIESGKLFLPLSASWLQDFEYEIFSFPKSVNDDQLDSLVQYLEWQITTDKACPSIRAL